MPRLGPVALLSLALGGPLPAAAVENPCDAAAARASAATGVPLALLKAIARAESGHAPDGDPQADAAPWPWTVQSGGRGDWFATEDEARARAEALREEGETNVDLGCFQINLHWHGAAFASLDAMLDPEANAAYAAAHLADLHARHGDWRAAAGAYHSADPDRAAAYVSRVEAAHDRRLAAGAAPAADPPSGPPSNPSEAQADTPPVRFTLSAAPGALLTAARGPLIGGP